MMGRTIFAHQSSTIPTEYDMEVEQCDIMDDIVEGSLRESAVDIAERQ